MQKKANTQKSDGNASISNECHIAILTKGRLNPAHRAASDIARRVLGRGGYAARQYVPEVADDLTAQTDLVRAALAANPTAILISPVLGVGAMEMVALIHAAGIPLAYFIDPVGGDDYAVTSVIGDDRAVGKILVQGIARAAPKGRIVIIEGYPEAETNRLRNVGLAHELRRHSNLTVAARLPGRYQRAPAKAAMTDWLAAERAAPDGVVAFNDTMALGALDALAERGWHCPVLGVNVIPEAVVAMRAGTLAGSVSFDPILMAALGAEALMRHLAGDNVPRQIMLHHRLVTANTLDDYATPVELRPLPDWSANGRRIYEH